MLATTAFNDQETLGEADASPCVLFCLNKFPANEVLCFSLAVIAKEALYFLGDHLEKPYRVRELSLGSGLRSSAIE